MTASSSIELERFLSGWERREAPPPPGVYVTTAGYHGRLVEEYCARYHLIYLVAVYDKDGACRDLYQCCFSQPQSDAPGRCFVFGDVEWRKELIEKCRVETYLYRFHDIRDALKTLLEFGMHVKGIPCTEFNIDVLRVTGWCDVDPICCDVSAVKEKIIEEAVKTHYQLQTQQPSSQHQPSGTSAASEEANNSCAELVRRAAEAAGVDVSRLRRCLCRT
jgi:hypothetical protein